MTARTADRRAVLLGSVASLASLAGLAPYTTAQAQAFPNKPIRIVLPNPPGGMSDLLGRGLGNYLAEKWSTTVVPDNKSGAAGAIGADIVAKSVPDGYTLFIGNIGPNAINSALVANLPYDPVKDFTAISQFMGLPNVLILHPSVPANSIREVIALAKTRTLSYASSGPGSSLHLSGELFQSMTGVKLTHVPYRGAGPAIADLLAGVVDMIFENITNALPHIRSGKVKALAVTTLKRAPILPNVPTMNEEGLTGFDVSSWFGLFAPAGLPAYLVQRYNEAVKGYLEQHAIKSQLTEMGAEIVGNSPEQFAAFVQSEIIKWQKVAKDAGIEKQ